MYGLDNGLREGSLPVFFRAVLAALSIGGFFISHSVLAESLIEQPVLLEIQPPQKVVAEPVIHYGDNYMLQLETAVNEVLAILRDPELAAPKRQWDRRAKLKEVVFREFDLKIMSQRAVGRGWRKFTPQQKDRFTQLFRLLLERTYIKLLERYQGNDVEFIKEVKQSKKQVRVDCIISTQKKDINLSYLLYRLEDGWRVVDLVVEGISIAGNYRSQFKRLLRRATPEKIEKLLVILQKKVDKKEK
jgi:phospholipid transport system substrate-binding protein